jgi:ferredoxin
VRVSVDASACTGHGRCYDVAPGLFEDDEEGYSVVKRNGLLYPREAEAATLAVRLCPERAIKLTE